MASLDQHTTATEQNQLTPIESVALDESSQPSSSSAVRISTGPLSPSKETILEPLEPDDEGSMDDDSKQEIDEEEVESGDLVNNIVSIESSAPTDDHSQLTVPNQHSG